MTLSGKSGIFPGNLGKPHSSGADIEASILLKTPHAKAKSDYTGEAEGTVSMSVSERLFHPLFYRHYRDRTPLIYWIFPAY